MAEERSEVRCKDGPCQAQAPARLWPRIVLATLAAGGLLLGSALGWYDVLSLQSVADGGVRMKMLATGHPAFAAAAFVLLGALAMALSLPAAALIKIVGGFLFGWLAGAVYIVMATTIGGTFLFLLARAASGDFLRKRAGVAARMAREFESGSFTYMLALRLAPIVPFFVASIAPGLFNVRLRIFVAATALGVVPGALCYAWVGQGLDDAAQMARRMGRPLQFSDMVTFEITMALFALTLVAALAAIVRKKRV